MHPPITTAHPADLWTPTRAARELGISVRTLASWRSSGRQNLPYVKVGRLVRYRKNDVGTWLESHLQGVSGGQA